MPVSYGWHPKNDSLLKQPEPYLKTFADGYYTISKTNGSIYFNILRFGQVQGWLNNDAPFALSYPVGAKDNENMVIQKGRFKGWNDISFKKYLEGIADQ